MTSNAGLYSPAFEHDACGIGFVANIKNNKSHQIVSDALTILENMEHRGACGCENNTGDGAGITIQTPHEFFFDECVKLGIHLPPFGRYGVGVLFKSGYFTIAVGKVFNGRQCFFDHRYKGAAKGRSKNIDDGILNFKHRAF